MFKQVAFCALDVSGSWISDRPAAEEHPVIPLGLNEMTVPRLSIIASFTTIFMLLVAGIWIALAANTFLSQFEDAFAAIDEREIQVDGRWTWEATLLFGGGEDSCDSRNGDWNWPSNLASQDELFWFPGELECSWLHQGVGDYAHLAIHNVDEENPLPLSIEINSDFISIDGDGQSHLVEVEAGDAIVIPLRLESEIDALSFTVEVSHAALPTASVGLDVELEQHTIERDRHARSEHLEVHYVVWDVDTGEQLDEGDLGAYAGEDPRCDSPIPWVCYIEGFGWGLVGLDVDEFDPQFESGTTHNIIVPPDLAYGGQGGHELEHSWLHFELTLTRLAPV